MPDPLSIIGSVVGVASLGIQVTQSLINLYNTYEQQSSDIANTLRNLRNLTDTLRCLEKVLGERTLTDDDQFWVERLQVSTADCKDAIEELKETCQKCTRTTPSGWKESLNGLQHQAAYPFRKNTLKKLNLDVGETRDNVSILLDVLQFKAVAKSQDNHDEIKALLATINGKQISSSLREWLNVPDAIVDHNSACEKKNKNPGSGNWLFENPHFTGWLKQENSLLWLRGFAGSGKSVLCSTAIQSAFRYRRGDRNIGIAFFYFTFTDRSKQDVSSMLRALLWQLSCQVPDGPIDLSQLHEAHKSGRPPSAALLAYLRRLIGRFHRTYIFVDALDECPQAEGREGVITTLKEMDGWDRPDVHLFITSRDESDIRQCLNHLAYYQIDMRNTGIDTDIANFISHQFLEDPLLSKLSKWHDRIRTVLTEGAGGVFRWVECQLKSLQNCPKGEYHIQRKLESLPRSLGATYERMLCNIDDDFIEDARRILTLLCLAYRPLRTEELIDGTAVDTCQPSGLNHSRKLSDIDDIRDICSGFVDIETVGNRIQDQYHVNDVTTTVRIAHFSVQEYLESKDILSSDAKPFSVAKSSAHSEIARICLIYLLEEGLRDSDFNERLIEQLPFAHYAATYWYRHYKDAISTKELEELVRRLFQNRQTFVTWIKLHDVDRDWNNQIQFNRQEDNIATSTYYASLLGLEKTVSILVNEQSAIAIPEQINAQGGYYGNALQAASSRGHQSVVRILLEKGADVNTRSGDYYGNALQAASYRGHLGIVRTLLEKGADVNAQSGHYFSNALQAASFEGHQNIVRILLEKGADVNTQSEDYYGNALQVASYQCHQDIIWILLDKGADVNAQGGYYGNALQAASYRGHQDIVRILLEKGADINAQGGYCGNALQAASYRGHQDIVRILLEKEADINAQGGQYNTALQAALYRGHQDIVRTLLDKGADIKAQGDHFNTVSFTESRGWRSN